MRAWLYDSNEKSWNKDDLEKALSDYESNDIKSCAQELDGLRLRDITIGSRVGGRYDREFNERQELIKVHERSGKQGAPDRSPEVYHELPNGKEWWRYDRYWGHRMH